MIYTVEILPEVIKQMKKLPVNDKNKILNVFENFKENPRPIGYKKLVDADGLFRFRVGNYRIIYKVIDDLLVVTVLKVGSRGDVYR